MWMIQVVMSRRVGEWEVSEPLPTFFLSEDILGILDEDSARNHAKFLLKSINPLAEYSISVRKVSNSPDLLEALEYALEFLVANDDGEDDVGNRIASAKAAIAKAKGE